jgi:hypothetical protein
LGTGVATFLGTPTTANFLAAITGETGTGACMFGTGPTCTGLIVSDLCSIGATPAAAGMVRLGKAPTVAVNNNAGSADLMAFEVDTSDDMWIGMSSASTKQMRQLKFDASLFQYGFIGTTVKTLLGSGQFSVAVPIIGYTNSPYSVHGTVISAMTDAAYTVPGGEYIYSQIEVPAALTLTADRAFKLPTPATEAVSYNIEVSNLTTGGFSLVVGRADGAGVTYTLLTGKRARFKVRPAGVYLITTTIT